MDINTQQHIPRLCESFAAFASDNGFALGHPVVIDGGDPEGIRVMWSVEDIPQRLRGFDRGEVILDVTRATGNMTDEIFLVSRLSPREALIVKLEVPYQNGQFPQEDAPGAGCVSYRWWSEQHLADHALTQIVRESRRIALARRVAWVFDGTHPAEDVAEVVFSAISTQSLYGRELLQVMQERATTAVVDACLDQIRRHARGIASVTLLDDLRDGEYGGMETYIRAFRITTHAGGEYVVSADLSLLDVTVSQRCEIIGDGDEYATCNALQRLGALHRSRRSFVITPVAES
jgi:hypothetical protein